ncbi:MULTISPECIES: hypothetical protein [unclassified Streptomyces]|uniref:hypothetical protein n=1 Tax=unclassified Streptomyces TaxID=2593676 RepID=UPI0033308163
MTCSCVSARCCGRPGTEIRSRALAPIRPSRGTHPIAKVKARGEERRPATLIRSSPWKAGTAGTPWHDVFDLDNGRVRYYGDHRVDHTVPVGSTQGHKVLLDASAAHQALTASERELAVPLLVFKAASHNKTPKGYAEFAGIAVIERYGQIEREEAGRTCSNYGYDLSILDSASLTATGRWRKLC